MFQMIDLILMLSLFKVLELYTVTWVAIGYPQRSYPGRIKTLIIINYGH